MEFNITLDNYKFVPSDKLRAFYLNEFDAPHELLHAIDRELRYRSSDKVDMEKLDKVTKEFFKKYQ